MFRAFSEWIFLRVSVSYRLSLFPLASVRIKDTISSCLCEVQSVVGLLIEVN